MKRRDVMKLGAVAAGAGIGVPGCAVPKMVSTMKGPEGAAAFNAMLDQQLAKLEGPGLVHRLVEGYTKKKATPEQREKLAEKDAQFRRMLSTVLITQAFRELPPETQIEPAVQQRMWSHYEQIGSLVYEVSDLLASLEPHQRTKIKTTLEKNPDLPMDLGQALDDRAARAGISMTRRLQMRKMISQTAFRFKNGQASSVIEEYVGKVEKLRPTDERNAAALDVATKVGERGFWRNVQRLADGAGPGSAAPPPVTAAPAPLPPPPPSPEPAHVKLHQAARSAARRGDCRAIDILGRRVRELDENYHRMTFSADPLIANCRPGQMVDANGQPVLAPPSATQPMVQQPEAKPQGHPGSVGLRVGAYMLGIGLAIGLVSALLISVGSDVAIVGVFGMTAAVIGVGIGLLVLLVAGIVYLAND